MTNAERELLLACAQQAVYHAQKSNCDDDARLRALMARVRDEPTSDTTNER